MELYCFLRRSCLPVDVDTVYAKVFKHVYKRPHIAIAIVGHRSSILFGCELLPDMICGVVTMGSIKENRSAQHIAAVLVCRIRP